MVVDIKLKDGQSGYEVIGEYFRRYWDNNHIKEVGKCRWIKQYSMEKKRESSIREQELLIRHVGIMEIVSGVKAIGFTDS